eukprot:COSAG01_NODE_644_length_14557_cov_8.020057_5_plen_95_part_00
MSSAVALVNFPVFPMEVVSSQLSAGLSAGIELVVPVLDDTNVESGTNSSSCAPKLPSTLMKESLSSSSYSAESAESEAPNYHNNTLYLNYRKLP